MSTRVKIVDDDNLMVPERFRGGQPHDDWRTLRSKCPIYYCEPTGFRPFWAVTKYDDIVEVERRADVFLNEPRFVVMPADFEDYMNEKYGSINGLLKMMAQMDAPEHRRYRQLMQPWFTPNALRIKQREMETICNKFFDDLRLRGEQGEMDLAQDLAFWFPLRVICALLGLPEKDDKLILQMANAVFSFQRPPPEADGTSGFEVMINYFKEVVEDRRRNPKDDLSTYLTQLELDGQPLAPRELLAYFVIAASAGHDTTSSAISGGIKALLEHPDQLQLLRKDRSKMPGAVDEILRWVTPTIQFCRTAAEDYVLRGQLIRKGESVALYFASGNRDEDVFENPYKFDIERSPNRHLTFGSGPHICLGLHIARMEIACFLNILLDRFDRLEISGPTPSIAANVVTRLERLPVRYRFRGELPLVSKSVVGP